MHRYVLLTRAMSISLNIDHRETNADADGTPAVGLPARKSLIGLSQQGLLLALS